MNFNLIKPCKNCPFRTDIRPFLNRERAEEIIESLFEKDQSFPCHKTVDYSHDDGGRTTKESEHCAGALILLEHQDRHNQMMRIAERLGLYDRRKLDMTSPVFDDPDDFIDAQNS
jgi:hypothetical protein